MNVVIVNYEMGNLGSLRNMLHKVGHEPQVSSDPAVIAGASHLILPGVGNFAKGMANLQRLGLVDVLQKQAVQRKTPTLGICLGMQLMARYSEEGDCAGLGWLNAKVIRFRPSSGNGRPLRVPHMGWNFLRTAQASPLWRGLETESRFYFVHSYHYSETDPESVAATTDYGGEFVSAVRRDNLFGVQFHPEKSHRFGMELLKNFLELAP